MDLTMAEVEAAAKLLQDVVRPTPLEDSRWLGGKVGGPVYLKCENLQRAGSFKIRGAYVRIARLTAEERENLIWLTAGALLDAECDLDVAVTHAVVATALRAPAILEVPPQYGACRFTTVAAPLDIDFLLAPTVWFEDGRAIRATPNLHAVRGLPTLLAGALVQAVNQDPEIEALIVAEINALLAGLTR
jgi:hypothetical protein